jgi:hypothetical protein
MQRSADWLFAGPAFSRRTAIRGLALGAAGFTIAQRAELRAMAKRDERLQDILNISATAERFGVTFLGEGLAANAAGLFDVAWPDTVVAVVTAARAQEAFHLQAFEDAGGEALYDTFTVPPETLTTFSAFFTALVEQETRETGAQIAAMHTFADKGRVDLATVSFQYAAEEAEHRLLANYTLGNRPANDRAFADRPYDTVADFLQDLEDAGIIEGEGTEISYPGPGDIDATNVTETEPETNVENCASSATPEASPASSPEASPVGSPEASPESSPEASPVI